MSRFLPGVLILLATQSPYQVQGQRSNAGSPLPCASKIGLLLSQNTKTVPVLIRFSAFQAIASASVPESPPARRVKIQGTVRFTSGGASAGTAIWVSPFPSPSQHLSEATADSSGHYSIDVNATTQPSGTRYLLLGAKHPEATPSWEVIDLQRLSPEVTLNIFLRQSANTLEEPDLNDVKQWLLDRLGGGRDCKAAKPADCGTYQSVLSEYVKTANDSLPLLQKLLPVTDDTKMIEARLLAALMLMRVGAWTSAEMMLANPERSDELLVERSLLQGVLWNVLRKPQEGVPALERVVRHSRKDALAELELGRARTLDEDWLNAQSALDDALLHHAAPAQVHFLRTRTLLARGDTEEAYLETKALTKSITGNLLPPEGRDLMAEVLGRLGESYNLLTEPVSMLVQQIPAIRPLDPNASPPPEGLEAFMGKVSTNVESYFKNFSETGAVETVRQAHVGGDLKSREVETNKYHYIMQNVSTKENYLINEYRTGEDGRPLAYSAKTAGLMITSNFVSTLAVFLPKLKTGVAYRFLGRQELAGRLTYVIAFAQQPSTSPALIRFVSTTQGEVLAHQQGIAWIDDHYEVLRVHTDLLYPLPDMRLQLLSADIDYRPRRLGRFNQIFWLPVGVTVNVDWAGKRLRNEHTLSDYVLFKVDTHDKIQQLKSPDGLQPADK